MIFAQALVFVSWKVYETVAYFAYVGVVRIVELVVSVLL